MFISVNLRFNLLSSRWTGNRWVPGSSLISMTREAANGKHLPRSRMDIYGLSALNVTGPDSALFEVLLMIIFRAVKLRRRNNLRHDRPLEFA